MSYWNFPLYPTASGPYLMLSPLPVLGTLHTPSFPSSRRRPALLEVHSEPGLPTPLSPAQSTSPLAHSASATLASLCSSHKAKSFPAPGPVLAVPLAWKALSLSLLLIIIQVTAPVSPRGRSALNTLSNHLPVSLPHLSLISFFISLFTS